MRKYIVLLLLIIQFNGYSQNAFSPEKPPVFPECERISIDSIQGCFDTSVFYQIYNNFKVPQRVYDENYKGEVIVLFEVDTLGQFRVLYTDALYPELKEEAIRVFSEFPRVTPAMYNTRKTVKQYSIPIKIPLVNQSAVTQDLAVVNQKTKLEEQATREFDSVIAGKKIFENKEYNSQLNIPFVHNEYAKFDRQMNLVGTNSHTGSKPFTYAEVAPYYDFKAEKETLKKEKSSWGGRKLWNEHLVQLQGKDYWFTIDPILDLQVGKDADADFNTTFNNTRGIMIQGGLGKNFNFYTAFFESQGRFADYVNRYAESIKAFGPDPAIVPGRGIGKSFKTDAYDYPVAEAYMSYTPSKFFNFQFGQGKTFVGDGYRSLVLSDIASPHPFFKINTKFWKIKYTNTWMWLKDVRPEVEQDKAFLTKYMANHYLSWNVSKRVNIGLFESVIWENSNNQGFDISYLNPIIFYRAIEFQNGQGAGNAILGLTGKYKWNDNINIYGQFVLDEFSLSDVSAGEKSWKNKYAYQLGVKYYNAFKVNNLMVQLEYNRIRPYTYSHNTIVLNYGHANQSKAHPWGGNLSETILIGRYHFKRWYANAKFIYGIKGFDFNTDTDDFSYGGDIYRDYNDRPYDSGVEVGQGIRTSIFNANLQAGYVINPASNLKIFADITFRDFDPEANTTDTFKNNTTWISFGIRNDLFNWYFDF